MAEANSDMAGVLLDGFPDEMLDVADELVITRRSVLARLFLRALPFEGYAIDSDLQEVIFRDDLLIGSVGLPTLPPLTFVLSGFLQPFYQLISQRKHAMLARILSNAPRDPLVWMKIIGEVKRFL